MIVRVGDRVYSMEYGWGEVKNIHSWSNEKPYEVDFNGKQVFYTEAGKLETTSANRTLFFDEIPIPVRALNRPLERCTQGGEYLYVDSTGEIRKTLDLGLLADSRRFDIGNYFHSYSEAGNSKFYKAFG